ncbi:hypothetical protein SteCoe_36844 [Stentor coeruleus]|uniref:Uncharacterized protein n=1 Tax=Stentor coeruleus TaxID=5963 RepID=A0A1R2APA8_9CILI|nr:hypothetical protein SteCoe_36844 [Stentor coeruleus]
MGCGKPSLNVSPEGYVISSARNNPSIQQIAHLASPIGMKQSPLSGESEAVNNEGAKEASLDFEGEDEENEIGSGFASKKSGWVDYSGITPIRGDITKTFALRLRSPTEIALKTEEFTSAQALNFDFLYETSNNSLELKKIIDEALEDLEEIGDD